MTSQLRKKVRNLIVSIDFDVGKQKHCNSANESLNWWNNLGQYSNKIN